jgi:hypothetical protein
MNRKLIGALLLALAGSFGGAASAAVIYDENDSSDVTGIHPGVDLGTLALGTSTVVGTLPGDFDADWFQFTIGVGMQLDDILIAAFTGPGGNVSFVGGTFTIFDVVNVGVNGNSIGVDILDWQDLLCCHCGRRVWLSNYHARRFRRFCHRHGEELQCTHRRS